MNKQLRKIASVGLAITTVVWLSGATMIIPKAQALTAAELAEQIALLLAQIQNLQAQLTALGGGTVAAACTFTRDLTMGSKGDDVKCFQQYLNGAGYKVAESGAGSPGSETTYFGSLTKAAVAKWQAANSVSPAVGYFGPKSRAKYTELAGVPGKPQCNDAVDNDGDGKIDYPTDPGCDSATDVNEVDGVVGTGLILSLASDNPGAQTVGRGAGSVPFLKFNVSGSGTLNSLTFKRAGIGATADFESSGVYLYEGTSRLTSGKSINSTTHEVTFVNLNLQVSGVKTLTLVADTAPGGTAGNVSRFELVSATGDPTPTGLLVGANVTLAGQQVGGIHVATTSAPTNPKIGQIQAKVQEFKLSASSTEDVFIKRISLTQGGSVSKSNVSNFTLKQSGNTLATVAAVGAKDLVTFVLDTPFKVEKGQERTFEVFADIGGAAKVDETVKLYFDSKSDLEGTGGTYGYSVSPDIRNMDTISEVANVTIEGGRVTITFNGPVAGNVPKRGQDVTLYDVTISSANNTEIKNLRIHSSTTDTDGVTDFDDLKVWDSGTNTVLTSAVDITTSTDTTFTDVIPFNAGQTRRLKVTADIGSNSTSGEAIRITLNAWQLGDIKNLDNNTNVALADIVPSTAVAGNTMTVKAPELTIGLAPQPTSRTYVRGTNDVALVGFSFRAGGGNVRLDTLTVTASSTTGAIGAGEVTSLALYDGTTRVSDLKSLNTSVAAAGRTINFTGLNKTITDGSTMLLTLKGNIDTNADNNDVYYFYLDSITSTDISAYDKDGNTVAYAGVPANETGAGSVRMTIATVGDVTVAKAADDDETRADIILANGTEQVLGKFVFSATNEDMNVKKISVMVNATSTAGATSTTTGDEVPYINLYDGATKIGGPYLPDFSGNSSSIVMIENLNWVIPKDSSNKVLTVKGFVKTIGDGADTGADVFVQILASGFEAEGASSKDNAITAREGNRKVVYKSKPTLSKAGTQRSGDNTLTAGQLEALRFTVAANGNGPVGFRQVQFQVQMTGATMTGATTSNVALRKVSSGASLALGAVYSGLGAASATAVAVTGGNTGYVGLVLTNPEEVSAGSSQDYYVELTFADISTTNDAAQATVKLYRQEGSPKNATGYAGVATTTAITSFDTDGDMEPSFLWTDRSVIGAIATTTADWANSVYVLPTVFTDVSNTLRN